MIACIIALAVLFLSPTVVLGVTELRWRYAMWRRRRLEARMADPFSHLTRLWWGKCVVFGAIETARNLPWLRAGRSPGVTPGKLWLFSIAARCYLHQIRPARWPEVRGFLIGMAARRIRQAQVDEDDQADDPYEADR